jgi:hypothetical protein
MKSVLKILENHAIGNPPGSLIPNEIDNMGRDGMSTSATGVVARIDKILIYLFLHYM